MACHSDEVEAAIFKMHLEGDDMKMITNRLKSVKLFVSRKLITLAIHRGQAREMDISNGLQEMEHDPNLHGDVMEEMEIDEADKSNKEQDTFPGEERIVEIESAQSAVAEEDAPPATEFQTVRASKPRTTASKPRRIKTTKELIERLREDFKHYPDVKVKERAAKFGIAVGTLCQIKHNILKMKKESGRTWKSTPDMVENIRDHLKTDPTMKVKERANKFGISVGTLCRIMHDVIGLNKRVVQRTGVQRAPRVPIATQIETPLYTKVTRKRVKKTSRTATGLDPLSLAKKQSMAQLCQLKMNSDGESGNQMIVMIFDQNGNQLQSEAVNISSIETNEVSVWNLNTSSTVEVEQIGDFDAHPESSVSLPETES